MPELKLFYFEMKGRGLAIRLALHIGGIPFTDERIPYADWPAQKAADVKHEKFPMGQMPVLKVDDKVLTQSHAILTYCGKLAGLYPKTEWEQIKVHEAVGCVDDIVAVLIPSFKEKDEVKKLAMRKAMADGELLEKFQLLDKILAKNDNPAYSVGNTLTIADLVVFQVLGWISSGVLDGIPTTLTAQLSALTKIHSTVAANPKVQEWLNKHEK